MTIQEYLCKNNRETPITYIGINDKLKTTVFDESVEVYHSGLQHLRDSKLIKAVELDNNTILLFKKDFEILIK